MKRCPKCGTTYTDATLSYCLSDGSELHDISAAADEQETVVRQGSPGLRVELPADTSLTDIPPVAQHDPADRSSNFLLKILVGLLTFALLAVAAIAIALLLYFNRPQPEVATNSNTATPRPIVSPASTSTNIALPATDETEELREQLANLERRLNEQRTANRPADIPLGIANQPAGTRTATVSSPGDGFLALRTYPNADIGSRILKVPHGANVTVGGCLNTSRVGNRSGRWCRASYNGYSGWVFDGWLVY